jgi:hypothetical protein
MSFTTVSERTPNIFSGSNTASHLGPGSYNYLPVGDISAQLKKKIQSRNAGGFNSHSARDSSYIPVTYTPGPGLYSTKPSVAFGQEFIASEDDPSQYFSI